MKFSVATLFLPMVVFVSCGEPVQIKSALKPTQGAADKTVKDGDAQRQESHVSPCGSFVGSPEFATKIEVVSPTKEQQIATGPDGRAKFVVTVKALTNVTCVEVFIKREDDASGQWFKHLKENISAAAVVPLSIELSSIGRNELALRVWSDGEPGAVVPLPSVDVVVSGGGDVSPVPTPTPGPTPQPEPLPTPVPTPLPDATWKYFYFEDVFTNYPDFSAMSPVSTGATSSFGMSEKGARTDNFAFVYEGESWVNGNPDVSGGQPFTFYLKCDEGCRLYINDFLAVDNYPSRGLEKSGSMKLSHRSIMSVRVEYFDKTGAENLEVNWAGPNFEKRPLTSDFLPF